MQEELIHGDSQVIGTMIEEALNNSELQSPSPRNLGGGNLFSAQSMTDPRAKAERKWEKVFRAVFDKPTAAEYASLFHRHKISPEKPMVLSNEDYREIGIPLGHRRVITELLVRVRAANEGNVDNHQEITLPVTPNLAPSSQSILNPICITNTFKCGLCWMDYEGESDSCDSFLQFVETVLFQKGTGEELPSSFLRAFWDNKPMPFASKGHTKGGRTAVMLLLRLPSRELVADPIRVKDSIMATMTNRFVIIYMPRGMQQGDLITYHKDPTTAIPWLEEIKSNVHKYLADYSRENFVLHLLSESMQTTKVVLDAYRSQLETLQDVKITRSPTAVVEWMNLIARQSQVLKRCLSRDAEAITEFIEILSMKSTSTLQVVADMLQSAEEIESNAYDAMQLRMGLVGFRSQENMKLFTFISAVSSPLAVLTGWYGMNFDAMPELHDPDAYNIFIAVAVSTLVGLLSLLWYLHRDGTGGIVDPTLEADVVKDKRSDAMTFVGRMKRGSNASSVDAMVTTPRTPMPPPLEAPPMLEIPQSHFNVANKNDLKLEPC